MTRSAIALTRAALSLSAFLLVSRASAERFEIAGGGDNLVKFESRAPLESFEGKTDRVSGWIEVDPGAVGDSVGVSIEVDLTSLDTGIPKRNEHMRENHLETATYPVAAFRGAAVLAPSGAVLKPGAGVTFEIEGDFSLHGITRRLRTAVAVTREQRGGAWQLHVVTSFDVTLADHAISRPKFLFLKLDETQKVMVDLVAVQAR